MDFLSQISVSHNIPQFLRSLLKFLLIQDSYPENPVKSTWVTFVSPLSPLTHHLLIARYFLQLFAQLFATFCL